MGRICYKYNKEKDTFEKIDCKEKEYEKDKSTPNTVNVNKPCDIPNKRVQNKRKNR